MSSSCCAAMAWSSPSFWYLPFRPSINGFNISHGIHSTSEEAVIRLTLHPSADLPMGLINVLIDFGDGNKNTSVINGSDSSFATTGLHFYHSYMEAVNYTIVIILNSPINSFNLTTEIAILEPIYGIEVWIVCIFAFLWSM